MREVGNTQIEGDGRLHTMLADPDELPVQEPGMPPIPRPPPGQRGRSKGPPVALIVGAILLVVVVAAFATVLALGYTVEIGDYEIGT